MECSVVTLSRSLGALGEDVGREVAQRLGFQYLDDQIITWAAEQAGVSPATIGQVERSQPLLARILNSLAMAPPVEPAGFSPDLMPMPDYSSIAYKELIAQVIADTAARGRCVIVAHGASVPLAGKDGLLRVFITASPEVRARRLVEAGLNDRDAHRAVESSDKERHDFFRRMYGVREELPTHYDLVVNTDVLSVGEVADVVLKAAGR